MNQTGYEVYHGRLECETKRIFCYSLPRKKVTVSYGNLLLFQINNFKNRSFSSGQGVVQSEPNWVWSIHGCLEFKTKRLFAVACLGKRLVFHTEICYYFRIILNK